MIWRAGESPVGEWVEGEEGEYAVVAGGGRDRRWR